MREAAPPQHYLNNRPGEFNKHQPHQTSSAPPIKLLIMAVGGLVAIGDR